MKKKFLITLFTIATTFLLSGCGNKNLNDNTESEEIITEDVVTTINVEITPPLSPQEEAEALEREENKNKMREMGAIKINYSQEVYETEEELSDEALKELQAKGSVSDFGLQIKYAEDGTFEYIPGYTIAYYTLEDGTPVLANKEERSFITEDNTKYYLVSMDLNDENTAIWVLEEEKYNSYSQK